MADLKYTIKGDQKYLTGSSIHNNATDCEIEFWSEIQKMRHELEVAKVNIQWLLQRGYAADHKDIAHYMDLKEIYMPKKERAFLDLDNKPQPPGDW
jgi:hypothetical protein